MSGRRIIRPPDFDPFSVPNTGMAKGRTKGFDSEDVVQKVLVALAKGGYLRDDTEARKAGILETVRKTLDETWETF